MIELSRKILSLLSLKFITYTVTGTVAVYTVGTYITDEPSDDNHPQVEEVEIADSAPTKQTLNRRPSSQVNKTSHAYTASTIYKPTAKLASKNDSNYVSVNSNNSSSDSAREDDDKNYRSIASNSGGSAPSTYVPMGINQGVTQVDSTPTETRKESTGPKSKIESIFDTVSQGIAAIPSMISGKTTTENSNESTASPTTPVASSGNSQAPTPTSNTCSSNIISGSFGNPLGVTISCAYTSQIKYCLAKDVCCDPDTQGQTYSSKIVVGKKDGNYCLSFYGTSATAGDSTIVQQNYTINSTLPNLTVGTPKTYFQTTELNENTFITSLDFGKPNHSIGQINMQTHDPGTTECAEIVESDHSMLAPLPLDILTLFDVSTASVSAEVVIPLRPDLLSYGENFITSFIKNNDFEAPLYSCSTSVITLDDFPYFQMDNAQAEIGNNSVREFEGQFTAYGFFEEDSDVYRGPAGVSSETKASSSLKSGMLGIFY